jgi:hypothetical protein
MRSLKEILATIGNQQIVCGIYDILRPERPLGVIWSANSIQERILPVIKEKAQHHKHSNKQTKEKNHSDSSYTTLGKKTVSAKPVRVFPLKRYNPYAPHAIN